MPSSFHFHLTKMVDWIVKIQPRRVLDIGVGHGKWGFLAREYTDIFANRYKREEWQTQIDGIEAFPSYKTPLYDYVYNTVHYGDVRQVLGGLQDGYDLAILGDVIEHFTKEDGQALLSELRTKCSYVLISSPTAFFQQDILNNPFETHHSFWTCQDFQGMDFDYDEFDHALFVALVRGDRPSALELLLDGKAASSVYSVAWVKRHPKLAQFLKHRLRKLPGYRPLDRPRRSETIPERPTTLAAAGEAQKR